MSIDSRLPNFRSLSPSQRLEHLQPLLGLSDEDAYLDQFCKVDPGGNALPFKQVHQFLGGHVTGSAR